MERDISVSSEVVRQLADQSLIYLNWFSSQTRRLLLVEDLVDSLKVRFPQNMLAGWLMLLQVDPGSASDPGSAEVQLLAFRALHCG